MKVSVPDRSFAHLSAQKSCISIHHLSGGRRLFRCRYVAILRNLCVRQNGIMVLGPQ